MKNGITQKTALFTAAVMLFWAPVPARAAWAWLAGPLRGSLRVSLIGPRPWPGAAFPMVRPSAPPTSLAACLNQARWALIQA